MSLFRGLEPAHPAHLPHACQRIETARDAVETPAMSLLELDWSSEDVTWLRRWLVEVPLSAIESRLSWRSAAPGGRAGVVELGTLLWAAWSHVALEESSGGVLWPHLREACGENLRRALFNTQGQLSANAGQLLRAAAQRLRLRHVFGRESTQEYYVSIQLQCGFPTPAARLHLHEWLVGLQRPRAVDLLLSDEDLRSSSFVELWQALRRIRRGEGSPLTKAGAKRSPWMRHRPVESLFETATAQYGRLGVSEPDDDDLEEQSPFDVRLLWPRGGRPRVELRSRGALPIEDPSQMYLVRSGGRCMTVIPAGSTKPVSFSVEPPSAEIPVDISTPSGEIAWAGAVPVWDPVRDFEVWNAESGESWSTGRAFPSHCILRLAPGWTLGEHAVIEASRGELWDVRWPEGARPELRDAQGGTLQIESSRREGRVALPITVHRDGTAELAGRMVLYVEGVPEEARIQEWRIGGHLAIEAPIGTQRRLELEIAPPMPKRIVVRGCGDLRGRPQIFRGEVTDVLQRGVAFEESPGAWRAVAEDPALDERIRRGQRVVARSGDPEQPVWIIEGGRVLEKRGPRSRPKPLSNLSAYGAPVRVVRCLRGRIREDVLAELGNLHVPVSLWGKISVDPDRVKLVEAGRALEDQHRFVLWLRGDEQPFQVRPEIEDEQTWVTPRGLCEQDDLLAAALAWNGTLVASWTAADLLRGKIASLATTPICSLALLRWFHAPIVGERAKGFLADVVANHSDAMLRAWIRKEGLPEDLSHCGEKEYLWNEAICEVLLEHAVPHRALASPSASLLELGELWLHQPLLALRMQAALCSKPNALCCSPSAVEVARKTARLAEVARECGPTDGHLLDESYLSARIAAVFEYALRGRTGRNLDDLPALLESSSFATLLQELADYYLPV